METRSKATRDLALSDDVIPSAEFPARMGESTPASGDLRYIGAAGIVGDSRPSSTRPPTEVVSPHMSIHEGDIDGPPLLQRADLAPITSTLNPCPLHYSAYTYTGNVPDLQRLVIWGGHQQLAITGPRHVRDALITAQHQSMRCPDHRTTSINWLFLTFEVRLQLFEFYLCSRSASFPLLVADVQRPPPLRHYLITQ